MFWLFAGTMLVALAVGAWEWRNGLVRFDDWLLAIGLLVLTALAIFSAFIFYKTFGGWKGAFGGLFNFVEELLPFTDFIPSFTITWIWQYLAQKKNSSIIGKNMRPARN